MSARQRDYIALLCSAIIDKVESEDWLEFSVVDRLESDLESALTEFNVELPARPRPKR